MAKGYWIARVDVREPDESDDVSAFIRIRNA